MGLFSRSKSKPKKTSEHDVVGEEEITTILRSAAEHKVLINVETGGQGLPERARIVGIEEQRGTQIVLRFYTEQGLSRGVSLEASFESVEWRWTFSTTVEEVLEDEKYLCRLPDILNDNERRGSLRARMRRTETTQVAAVSGLFAGTAATGVLVEASHQGFCFRPTKVMDVASKDTLAMSALPFGVGKQFVVIRMKVPGAYKEAEFSATVRRVWGVPPGLTVALEFDKIKDEDLDAIKRMVDARVSRRAVTAAPFPDEAGGSAAGGVEIGSKAEAKPETKPDAAADTKPSDAQSKTAVVVKGSGVDAAPIAEATASRREEEVRAPVSEPASTSGSREERAEAKAPASETAPARGEAETFAGEPVPSVAPAEAPAAGFAPETLDDVGAIEVQAMDMSAAPIRARMAPVEAFRRAAAAVAAPQVLMDRQSGVLIVGDTSISRSQMRSMVSSAGYREVYEADGGQRAIEMLSESPCALVLLSMNLSDMPPLKFILMMRESEALREVPIIVVARTLSHGEIIGLKGSGVNDILLRPIDPAVLTAKIAKFIPPSPTDGPAADPADAGE